ncbi:MAG: hypothetical protein A3H45_12740 [Ignavibacteria bacterium RIFCSPLOWO2_02_FULL_55_14]|nr:MAG: hypothetical protein A2X68_07115 [Ignavibacteria bacterium GWC2_56_12]OGU75094.1 MAG: hypothetical protein A3H45_12740 [Ignavibacteria bacterium RIFCSPLOWO2_02_FULL_55_14]HAV24388.1 hypothetical protein [Bacteroidota bacterium]
MAASRKPRSTSKPIGEALEGLIKDLGIEPKLREYEAVLRWEEAVGAHIAKIATAERIQNGVLGVRVTNGTWRYELTLRKKDLIAKLNSALGAEIVKDIRLY